MMKIFIWISLLAVSEAVADNEAFKTYFLNFEGKKLQKPTRYLPDQSLLEKHRTLMP
jgi:hypothetical protein